MNCLSHVVCLCHLVTKKLNESNFVLFCLEVLSARQALKCTVKLEWITRSAFGVNGCWFFTWLIDCRCVSSLRREVFKGLSDKRMERKCSKESGIKHSCQQLVAAQKKRDELTALTWELAINGDVGVLIVVRDEGGKEEVKGYLNSLSQEDAFYSWLHLVKSVTQARVQEILESLIFSLLWFTQRFVKQEEHDKSQRISFLLFRSISMSMFAKREWIVRDIPVPSPESLPL